MKTKIIILSLVLIACSKVPIEKWEPEEIIGFDLSLIDQKSILSLSFSADHNLVAATIGTVDGPKAAPLWYWEIDKQGILLIKESDRDRTVLYKLSKLYEKNGRIGVEQTDNRLLTRYFPKKVEFEKKEK
jgi:hypothetical protein